ncbi:MAG: putative 4-hydroxybenzoate polyprenyltransferase [Verrucomicrobiota bacterium]|nr:putative 4-hydroxybenzoate polyprenyltransferase [Verrucomicrobiota bacterium]
MSDLPAGSIARFLHLVRFSHTIFALPFALAALIVSADGRPSARVLLLVLACMITARTAAMLFNRVADWEIDQRNPRTQTRHRLMHKSGAIAVLLIASALFVGCAAAINHLTLLLAPVALAAIFFYSLTKRFTNATHFFLGLALGIAPVAAWIAQTSRIAWPPIVLASGVVCWVAGFDLIYATQDRAFDQREGLRSLVVRLGLARSLRLAQILHLLMLAALIGFGFVAKLGTVYFVSMLLVVAALVYEHRSARRLDVVAINRAFFNANAFVSALFLIAVCVDRWWPAR